jgi:regulator of sigma E protease
LFESSFFLSFIGFFLVLTPLVFVHEFGHYYAAIKSGVKVETFSIGFGPELLGFNDNKNTRWKFSLIPLGGYVKMKGELINLNDNSNKNSLEKDSFLKASLLSRFIIVGSGPLANLLLGLLLITSLYALNGRYISSTIINSVVDSKPAQLAGILPNDKVISIDGELVENFEEIKQIVESKPKVSVIFQILRDNNVLNLNVVPINFFDEKTNKLVGRIGITAKPMVLTKLSLIEAFKAGIYDTYKLTTDWLIGFKSLLSLNIDKKDVVGPIGIAKISGSSLDQGFFSIIFLMAILSINLGLINLLPIPALDGGYILLYAYELIFKKPLPSKIQTLLLKFGFIFLLMLMFLITAFDLGF